MFPGAHSCNCPLHFPLHTFPVGLSGFTSPYWFGDQVFTLMFIQLHWSWSCLGLRDEGVREAAWDLKGFTGGAEAGRRWDLGSAYFSSGPRSIFWFACNTRLSPWCSSAGYLILRLPIYSRHYSLHWTLNRIIFISLTEQELIYV